MRVAVALLASTFVASPAALAAPSVNAVDPSSLVGVWELTGVGGDHNLVTPRRQLFEFTPEGELRICTWEDDDPAPSGIRGHYVVRDDLLELTGDRPSELQVFRIVREGTVLILESP